MTEGVTEALRITGTWAIPVSELTFRATRSGGPGGQHVNTSCTRVELLFDARRSVSIGDVRRALVLNRLDRRLDQHGVLRVVSHSERSQLQNRKEARRRLRALLQAALAPRKTRRPTKPTRGSRERRLTSKRQRSAVKRLRRRPPGDD